MNFKIIKYIAIVFVLICMNNSTKAQYSQYQLGDTSKRVYPYKLPFLGAKAYENGFNLPLPAGFMLNYFIANQDVVIPEIAVGFADGILPEIPLTDITRIIDFEEVSATAWSINVRPDIWIFPFLNVYGIFGKAYAQTNVKLSYPIELSAQANLEGSSYGIGTTGAFGVGPFFCVMDGNWVWSNMDNFTEPVKSSTFSMRLGKAFTINESKQSNFAIWAGAMRIRMGNITEGHITLRDVLPDETWAKRDEVVNNYWAWYEEQDAAQKLFADKIFTPIVNNIAEADGAGTIHYKLEKKPKQEWNMIIGGQYQINPKWQLRTEGGIVGNRKSFLFSANYRFGF